MLHFWIVLCYLSIEQIEKMKNKDFSRQKKGGIAKVFVVRLLCAGYDDVEVE